MTAPCPAISRADPADPADPAEPPTPAPVVSRPLRWAAHAAALTLVPSGLWRCAMAFGWPTGFAADSELHHSHFPAAESFYLIGLSLVAEALGLLTIGLIRPWGERAPRWLPYLGGRRLPVALVAGPAALGAAAVTALAVLGAFSWNAADSMGDPSAPDGGAYWVMTLAYAPLLAWGPLLAVVTAAYVRRRRTRLAAPPVPGS